MRAKDLHRGQANAVHAGHDAGSAFSDDMIVPGQHLVDVTGKISRVHHLFPSSVGMVANHSHDCRNPLVEGAVRTVGLEFIVLDEIDVSFDQCRYLRSGGLRRKADTRLDDGADKRPVVDSGQLARASYTEL